MLMQTQIIVDSDRLRVISPPRRFTAIHLSELWDFRELVARFVSRDVKLRYRQTALGVVWVLLQPLMAAGVFTFVFGHVAAMPSEGVPYFAFSYAGMLGWNLFSGTIQRFSASLVGNTALVSKIYFPRLILPFSTLGSLLLDFFVALSMMFVIIIVIGADLGIGLLTLPLWLALSIAMGAGIGLALSAMMIKYRDVGYILPVALQILMYATPIAYSLTRVPGSARIWVEANPLCSVIVGFRWCLLGTHSPGIVATAWGAAAAVVLLVLGLLVFTRMDREFADVI
jgi:lipopolysaccharide transport system permease protein